MDGRSSIVTKADSAAAAAGAAWRGVVSRAKRWGAPLYYAVQQLLPLKQRRYLVHALRHHRILHLRNPRTFSEKLSWRMVYDRRDLLAPTCDKKAMKELARERAGDLVLIPRTLWSGRDVSELASVPLPEHWVLKPNHRSGLVYFGHGPAQVEELVRITKGWLKERHWQKMGEWAYLHAEPTMLVEERIGHPRETLLDYKFIVFDGVVRALVIHQDRFDNHRRYIFRPDFTRVPVRSAGDSPQQGGAFEKPDHYDLMIEVAMRIATDFDHLRVDLYSVGDDVWFGEVTPYHANGIQRFRPPSWDLELGSYWTLPDIRPSGPTT